MPTVIRLLAAVFGATLAAQALAQPPAKLSFEVASIKPLDGQPSGGFRYLPGGRFTGIVYVSQLLSAAYPGIPAVLGDIVGPTGSSENASTSLPAQGERRPTRRWAS